MAFVIRHRTGEKWWAGRGRGWVSEVAAAAHFEFHLEAALITISECGPSMELHDIQCIEAAHRGPANGSEALGPRPDGRVKKPS